MENGQIFHVTRIGKYYCKNMRYRINSYSLCLTDLCCCHGVIVFLYNHLVTDISI